MRFEDFARIHGLIIDRVIPHRQVRTPTEDHPRSRTGLKGADGPKTLGWAAGANDKRTA